MGGGEAGDHEGALEAAVAEYFEGGCAEESAAGFGQFAGAAGGGGAVDGGDVGDGVGVGEGFAEEIAEDGGCGEGEAFEDEGEVGFDLFLVVGIDLGDLDFGRDVGGGLRGHVAGEHGFEFFEREAAEGEAVDEGLVRVGAEFEFWFEAAGCVEVDEVVDFRAGDGGGHREAYGLVAVSAWAGEAEEAAGERLDDFGDGGDGLGLAGFFQDGQLRYIQQMRVLNHLASADVAEWSSEITGSG